ncbi:MAG: glycoside hydrolase family 2 [Candidatus Hydrogenedentes bacterium]|nr:glycoside hydrolase family 2 [Candidatus Hydrogenedentota bacterium]
MKQRLFSLIAIQVIAMTAHPDALQDRFANPPETTKPRCYWYWMDGHISREGITKDLEAMRSSGIGGAYIGVISGQSGMPANAGYKALSESWWGYIEHAVREAGRIGVDIGLFNSPGWSQSGGPWVRPEQSMRYVLLPEIRVRGPQRFEGPLPTPAGPFQDVAVVAFPVPECDGEYVKETARTSKSVLFESQAGFTARSLVVELVGPVRVVGELKASDDDQEYRIVTKFEIDRHNVAVNVGPIPLAPIVVSFPATRSKNFRLDFSQVCELGQVLLSSAARVERYPEKSLAKMFQDPLPPFDFYEWPAATEPDSSDLVVSANKVRDLSALMDADGTLRWDVPDGEWIVQRAVMVPTGTQNSPAPPEATGLEVDKMNRTALVSHFDAFVGDLLQRLPAKERTAWTHVVADSYEMGSQNWTDGFADDFRRRFGYDPIPWLPTMTGRIVGSADQSDRFLWDLRRAVADKVARDYVGGLRDLCSRHGLTLWLENYGHWGFPSEFLRYGGASDEIGGEFWVTGNLGSIELRAAASAAHTYGKRVVWSEAFTGGPSFVNTPRDLKARGDWAFCEGANQFVLHVYIHQPWDDKKPGVNAWFGTEFNRHNTWFEYMTPWVDYLRRCSVMLQTGNHVADVAYFIGEDSPKMTGPAKPSLPKGYDFDFINAEVIEKRLRVRNGQFVLPSGQRYRLLVLPESETMRPKVLKKLQRLVAHGGTILGTKPERSPSMEDYPACDENVRRLADALWNNERVLSGIGVNDALERIKISADVVCPQNIVWKHRHVDDADIYFLSNQTDAGRVQAVSFRVNGRSPELWWPDTGSMEPVRVEVRDGRSEVEIPFDPYGSVFVVFRKNGTPAVALAPTTETVIDVSGPWSVTFPSEEATFEKLVSWAERPEPRIRFYSGTATYRTTFALPGFVSHARLNLGAVEAIAAVRVNGKSAGTLWKYPYSVDIGGAAVPGMNTLEVDVVNSWLNRLVGDERADAVGRQTFVTTKTWKSDTPLKPSGLLGPVSVTVSE